MIADEGLPVYHESEHGNLYVEYSVVLPTKLSAKTKAGKLGDVCTGASKG